MARSLNIVIGADIEKLQKGFNDAVSVVQSSGKKMSEAAAETAKSIQDRLASIATKNPTAGTVRQLTNLAMEARALGPEFAGVANQIIQQAGRIKDSIGDARAEVSYFSSDTRRLDAVLGGVSAVAGAFGAVEGALALTGVESEDLQKTMVKLQGAIALVNGVQAIQSVLLDENATKTGVLALANRLYTSVTAGATGATLAFRTALMSIGIGVVIAGIGALVANFDSLKDAIFPADKALKDLNNTLDKTIAKNERDIRVLEAKGDKLGVFALQEKNLNETLKKARANFGKNNKENWGKIVDDTKTALLVLEIERDKYNEEEKAKKDAHDADILQKQEANHGKRLSKLKKFNEDQAKELAAFAALEAEIENTRLTKNVLGGPQKILDPNADKEAALAAAERATYLEDLGTMPEIPFENFVEISGEVAAGAEVITTSIGAIPPAVEEMANRSGMAFQIHAAQADLAAKKTEEVAGKMKTALEATNQAFAKLQTDAAVSFGQFLGDLATGEKDAGKNFGKNMLGAIAAFMDSLGKALIATAVASEAFQKLIIANPAAAAAAGIALIAGAAIVRNSLKEGPQATAFAEGGIVSGPTLGLVGEYPGASSNPEVIAPLDKLKGMLNMNNNNSGFVASTTIQGRDLAIVLERYNKDARRG